MVTRTSGIAAAQFAAATCLIAALLGSTAAATTPTNATSTEPRATSSDRGASVKELSALQVEISSLKEEMSQLKVEVKAAKEDKAIGTMEKWMLFITLLLTAVLVGAAGMSFNFGYREQARASEMHRISVSSERLSETHADAFLTGSARTLALVNQTLDLARQATERTVRGAEAVIRAEIAQCDNTATALIRAETSHSDRRLVSDTRVRDQVVAVASDIEDLERDVRRLNREMTSEGAAAIELTPASLFILGMSHHIEGRVHRARKYWERAANLPQCPKDLASRIWYWIGYEQNNVGESGLEQAVASFRRALEGADGVRELELRRLEIETRFFDRRRDLKPREIEIEEKRRQLYLLADALQDLAQKLDGMIGVEFRGAWSATLTTMGNIRWSVGMGWIGIRSGQANDESNKQFTHALEYYTKAAETGHIWALFGKAQAMERLGKDATAEYRGVLEKLRLSEFARRREPRTRMLNYATQMRCGLALKAKSVFDSALREINDSHGSVESPVTIYSQERKCNVNKETWLSEIKDMEQEAKNLKGKWLADEDFV